MMTRRGKRKVPHYWRPGGGSKKRSLATGRLSRLGRGRGRGEDQADYGELGHQAIQAGLEYMAPGAGTVYGAARSAYRTYAPPTPADSGSRRGEAGPSRINEDTNPQELEFGDEDLDSIDGDEIDVDPEQPEVGGGGGGGGMIAPSAHRHVCPPRYLSNMEQLQYEVKTLESCYPVLMKIVGNADNGIYYTIPWEFAKACHSQESIMRAFADTAFWKPLDAEVELFDVREHAEIPLSNEGHLPISIEGLRFRFLKGGFFTSPRSYAFDSNNEYQQWYNVRHQMDNGEITQELPKTRVWRSRSLNNDYHDFLEKTLSDQFEEKKDYEGTVKRWYHKIRSPHKHPWRSHAEFIFPQINRLDAQGAGAEYHRFFAFTHFNYYFGAINTPMHSIYTDGTNGSRDVVFYNFETCTDEIRNTVHHATTDSNEQTGRRTNAEKVTDFGTEYQSRNIAANAIPYTDHNPMQPIAIDVQRFMNNDNIQPIRVYAQCRIKHRFLTLKNNFHDRYLDTINPSDGIDWGASARYPFYVQTGNWDYKAEAYTSMHYCRNGWKPIYQPCLFRNYQAG